MNARVVTVAALSAALLAGGATAAVAAPAAAPKPAITVKASATKVHLGDPVTFIGGVVGLKDGSKVTLQVKHGSGWVSLPATAKVKEAKYKLTGTLQEKGREVLRVKDGKTVSKAIAVLVG